MGDGECQGEQEGLQDLNLLDDLLALGRKDVQYAYLGGARKMDVEAARQKVRERKAKALGYHETGD